MKNIHVLPTEQPSRLFLGNNGNFVFGMIKTSIQSRNDDFTNQNIYITSDEEIKEGDWRYNSISNSVYQKKLDKISFAYEYKIILTTDQDLIKDGVQAIDDEFLEWFVQNPSCESVEIEEFEPIYGHQNNSSSVLYKTIIPKEEPKQETLNHIVYNIGECIRIINPTENQPKLFITHKVDNDFGVVYYYQLDGKEESIGFSYIKKEEPNQYLEKEMFDLEQELDIPSNLRFHNSKTKQKTLEELADKWVFETNGHKWSNNNNEAGDNFGSFIAGFKEAEKTLYSGEEVLELLITCKNKFGGSGLEDYTHDDEVKEWFEQIKNK